MTEQITRWFQVNDVKITKANPNISKACCASSKADFWSSRASSHLGCALHVSRVLPYQLHHAIFPPARTTSIKYRTFTGVYISVRKPYSYLPREDNVNSLHAFFAFVLAAFPFIWAFGLKFSLFLYSVFPFLYHFHFPLIFFSQITSNLISQRGRKVFKQICIHRVVSKVTDTDYHFARYFFK
jgi:hypothetical protein